jgi:hypothetical protein
MGTISRARISGAFVVAVTLCALAFFAGCGDDSTSGESKKSKPPPAQFDPKKLLMQKGEEPGFSPAASAQTNTQPFPMGPAGTKRLQESGFISSTYAPLKSSDGGGASSITLFKTATGARDWMKYETTDAGIKQQIPDPGRIRHFSVPGVPGARGWTGLDLHGNKIGQVYWADGRCEFVIGNEGNPPFVELRAGAQAWHERTEGMCPDA